MSAEKMIPHRANDERTTKDMGSARVSHSASDSRGTAVETRLSAQYRLRVGRKLRFLVLFNAALALFLILKPVGSWPLRAIDDLAQVIGPGVSLAWFIVGAGIRRQAGNRGARPEEDKANLRPFGFAIWIWLSVACYVLAQSVYTYLELTTRKTPQSSLCDVLYFSVSFAVLAGIVTLPTRPTPAAMRTRIVLDGLTIMAGAVTFSWYFLVGPMLLNATAPLLTRVVGACYPLQQLLLVFCFLRLTARMGETVLQPAMKLLCASILIDIAAQSIYGYQLLHNAYVTGSLLDVLWSAGIMLLGLAAYAGRLASIEASEKGAALAESDSAPEASPNAFSSLLPYGIVPVVVVFAAIIGSVERDTPLKAGVYIGAGILVALTLLRQSFAFLENAFLYNRLHEAYDSLAENNRRAIEHAESMRKINAELKSVQNELVHSAKLASLGTLSTGVAHELNQPLAVIRGMVQQLLGEPDLDSDKREDLTLIEGQTSRMMKIIQHLRSFARAGNDERKDVDVNQVIQDCFILVGTQLKSNGIRVELDLTPDAPVILGDGNELEQVLLNLVTNARDAMEGGPDPCLHISTRLHDGECQIVCRDNGPGIPDEIASQVFDPFFTTKDPGKGTGLGLSISHSIIRKHHGTIHVKNSGGAVFTVTLPLADNKKPSGSSGGRAASLDMNGEGAANLDRAA
jgi:signal transduction histidine kinase